MPLILAALGFIWAGIAFYVEPLLVSHRTQSDGDEHNSPLAAVPIAGIFRLRSEPWTGLQHDPAALRRARIVAIAAEIVLSGVFAGLAVRYHGGALALACLYSALLFQISIIDLHYRLVLNALTYPGAILAFGGSFLWPGLGPGRAALGGLVGLVLFLVLELLARGGLGRGDTKLAALIGLMRGYPDVWTAALAGVMVGGIVAAALLVTGRGRRETFAYGPWLAAGAIISLFISGQV